MALLLGTRSYYYNILIVVLIWYYQGPFVVAILLRLHGRSAWRQDRLEEMHPQSMDDGLTKAYALYWTSATWDELKNCIVK